MRCKIQLNEFFPLFWISNEKNHLSNNEEPILSVSTVTKNILNKGLNRRPFDCNNTKRPANEQSLCFNSSEFSIFKFFYFTNWLSLKSLILCKFCCRFPPDFRCFGWSGDVYIKIFFSVLNFENISVGESCVSLIVL